MLLTSVGAMGAEVAPRAALDTAEQLMSSTPGETRSLLIIHNGKTVIERYRSGYSETTRHLSWSVAKSVTSLAIGMLADEGKLSLDAPAPVEAWRKPGDPRAAITLRHLLTMSSGLEHQESRERGLPVEIADTMRILFTDATVDGARHAISKPLVDQPGSTFRYSTATSQIIADIATRAITDARDPAARRAAVSKWFSERLWSPLGITSAEWTFDDSGLFLGGAMLYLTAPDFAKLGGLMLARGVAPDGRRLVSERWLDFMTTRGPATNTTQYGGHIWLNRDPGEGRRPVLFHPAGTPDTYAMIGHLGQYVVVVPSKRLVIVRLGKTPNEILPPVQAALGRIIDAFPAAP